MSRDGISSSKKFGFGSEYQKIIYKIKALLFCTEVFKGELSVADKYSDGRCSEISKALILATIMPSTFLQQESRI
ncbi:hypothetical protein [Desulfonatronum parangueonense]